MRELLADMLMAQDQATVALTEYFTKLRHLTKDADGDRPELREARARVTKQ